MSRAWLVLVLLLRVGLQLFTLLALNLDLLLLPR